MADVESSKINTTTQSPFFRAIHSPRYERQESINKYEDRFERSLIIFWGPITEKAIVPFADAINDIQQDSPQRSSRLVCVNFREIETIEE